MLEFRLTYRGPLKTKGSATKFDKHSIRKHFQVQLKALWAPEPLVEFGKYIDPDRELHEGDISFLELVGSYHFAPLVSQAKGWHAVCSIDILFMRPSQPGQLIGHGGDVPKFSELPDNASAASSERPFHCLLQDDALVTNLSVRTDRLLAPVSPNDVELVIHVCVSSTSRTTGNDPIW